MEFDLKKHPEAGHESQHAVAIWYYGGKINRVTITGPIIEDQSEHLRTPYYVSFESPEAKSLDQLTADDIYFRLVSCLAPRVAEIKFFGKPSDSSLNDLRKGLRTLSPAYEHPAIRPLVEDAQKVINGNGDWESAALEFFEKHSGPVEDFFNKKEVEKAVLDLSQHLAAKGSLTGFETASFLESVWSGPLPKKAKPASEHSNGFLAKSLANTLASTNQLIELIRYNINTCEIENEVEEEILEKANTYILQSLFKVKELQAILHTEVNKNGRS